MASDGAYAQPSTQTTTGNMQASPSSHVGSASASTALSPPPAKVPQGSGSTPKQSTLSRRQHAAHRAHIVGLSKQLKTRLQYATFKVEHGWSKQSLSEVENLYYRHCKATGTSTSTSAPSSGSQQISPSSARKGSIPSTPKFNSSIIPALSSENKSAAALTAANNESDVFGGLMTPPASGGAFPAHSDKDSAFSGNPSFASGLRPQQRSPTAGLEGKNSKGGNQGKSYADFWSKIGTAGVGQGSERQ